MRFDPEAEERDAEERRSEIRRRRGERFFGTPDRPEYGICADFERIGDRLWQAEEIARALADRVPGGCRAIIERFKFSVKAGKFGPPASNGRFAAPASLSYDQRYRAETTRNLIDLDSAVLRPPEAGQYALRPSVLVAVDLAPYMRARRSIWAHWIASQRWPVPPELGSANRLDAETALPTPTGLRPGEQEPKARRGRSEAPYWEGAHREIDNLLEENGCPQPGDGRQAELEKHIGNWLADRVEDPPSESTIRAHVKARIKLFKKKIDEGR
jgi:hypothetical protein